MATEEKDIQERQKRVATLARQVEAEQAKRDELVKQKSLDAEAARLDSEIVRLERQLESEKALTAQQKQGALPTVAPESPAALPASGSTTEGTTRKEG